MTAQPEAQATSAESLVSIPFSTDLAAIDLALDAMAVGIFEYDPVTGAHRFSDRCKSIWGFAASEDPTPEDIMSRVHPDDRHVGKVVWQAISPGGSGRYSIEHRIVLPDGTLRWVQVAGRTVFQESHGVRRALRGYGALRDITESKVAEQRIAERTSQLQAFVEEAPVPIVLFDRNMRYVAYSRVYAQERGVAEVNLVGRCAYDVFPNMPEHWRQRHQQVLSGATERGEEEFDLLASGRREWVRWELRPWYGADQKINGIIMFAELVTKRIKEQQALLESQARLELAVRAGAMGIYDFDLTSGNITWDARVREITGVGPDEPITYDTFLQLLHPEERARADTLIREASEGDIPPAECRVVNRSNGAIRWVSATGRVLVEGGRPVRIVGVVQDVTDRKWTELALEQSLEELRRADQRKDMFLATLSHELRNPLAPIRTAAQLLASPSLTPKQLKWVSEVIGRQSGHMATLLEDLLEVTRISRGKLVLRKEHTQLSAITQSAIESTRPLLDAKSHRLHVSLPAEPLTLEADPVRLAQVLSNLLENASKYTDPGGDIHLCAGVEDGSLVIRVKDNGIGIASDCIESIFTMFWQVQSGPGHTQGGLGIGLAFVKGILHLHGGTIEAHSEGPGHGSEFIVRLPIGEGSQARADSGQTAGEAGPRERHRILIADDDKDTADTLQMLLTLSHHDVRVVYNGQEAVTVARGFRPDLALIDLDMPGLDGYGVARALRQEPATADLRLVALSGFGQPEDQRRASAAGFDEQLVKPIDPKRLQRLL